MSDITTTTPQRSILAKVGETYGLSGQKLYDTLADTVFPAGKATPERVQALLIVADQYTLNPFTKEIYAFPAKGGGIAPVVSIDGWLKLINSHPQMDGLNAEYIFDGDRVIGCTCTIWRKDRGHPCTVTETVAENKRNTDPWNNQPRRMIRHRAIIQCARVAFGFAGIYEADEAARFVEAELIPTEHREPSPESTRVVDQLNAEIEGKQPDDILAVDGLVSPDCATMDSRDEQKEGAAPAVDAGQEDADGWMFADGKEGSDVEK